MASSTPLNQESVVMQQTAPEQAPPAVYQANPPPRVYLTQQQRSLLFDYDYMLRQQERAVHFRPTPAVCPRLNILNHNNCVYCSSRSQHTNTEAFLDNVVSPPVVVPPVVAPPAVRPPGRPSRAVEPYQPRATRPILPKPDLSLAGLMANGQPGINSIQAPTTSSHLPILPPVKTTPAATTTTPTPTNGDAAPKRVRRKSQKPVEPRVIRPLINDGGFIRQAVYGDLLLGPVDEDDGDGNTKFPHIYHLNPTGPFRFLSLPAEVRSLIYHHLVDFGEHGLLLPKELRANHQPAITRVSRSIRNETLPILYGQNMFYAKNRELCKIGPQFVEALGDARCSLIRHFKWFTAKRTIEIKFHASSCTVTGVGPKGNERREEILKYLSSRPVQYGLGYEDIVFITNAVLRVNTKD